MGAGYEDLELSLFECYRRPSYVIRKILLERSGSHAILLPVEYEHWNTDEFQNDHFGRRWNAFGYIVSYGLRAGAVSATR